MNQSGQLKRFLDKNGKIKVLPKRPSQRRIVLNYLSEKFELSKVYTEKEVNQILNEHHLFNDPALLRRELFDNSLLDRTEDGSKYWRQEGRSA